MPLSSPEEMLARALNSNPNLQQFKIFFIAGIRSGILSQSDSSTIGLLCTSLLLLKDNPVHFLPGQLSTIDQSRASTSDTISQLRVYDVRKKRNSLRSGCAQQAHRGYHCDGLKLQDRFDTTLEELLKFKDGKNIIRLIKN